MNKLLVACFLVVVVYAAFSEARYVDGEEQHSLLDRDVDKKAEKKKAITFTCPTAQGTFSIPGVTCNKQYYICVSSMVFVKTCPAGSVFDTTARSCIPNRNCKRSPRYLAFN